VLFAHHFGSTSSNVHYILHPVVGPYCLGQGRRPERRDGGEGRGGDGSQAEERTDGAQAGRPGIAASTLPEGSIESRGGRVQEQEQKPGQEQVQVQIQEQE